MAMIHLSTSMENTWLINFTGNWCSGYLPWSSKIFRDKKEAQNDVGDILILKACKMKVVFLTINLVASTFFSPSAAGAGATFAGDAFFFTT